MRELTDYINELIPALKKEDTIQRAIDWMEEYKLSSLAVETEEGVFQGVVFENFLLEQIDWSLSISEIGLLDNKLCLSAEDHVFEAFKFVKERKIDLVPIVHDLKLIGVITLPDLTDAFGDYVSTTFTGGIVVINLKMIDYSLAEISRIAEMNGAKIISASTFTCDDPVNIDLVLKFNTMDLNGVVSAYERHDFKVIQSFFSGKRVDQTESNLSNFLKYLDV